jgi:DNA polymerase III delta prime subunit
MSTKKEKGLPPGSYILITRQQESPINSVIKQTLGIDLKVENNPDLYLVNQETIGIEEARKIKRFLSLKHWRSPLQTVIIGYQKEITPQAQNALLKILEEPGENRLLVIISSNKSELLPTIISRCQVINLVSAKKAEENHHHVFKKNDFGRFLQKAPPKEELRDLLQTIMSNQQQELINARTHEQRQKLNEAIQVLSQALSMLDANVDSQSVIDWLWLSL